MKKNATELVLILDKSGSMASLASDVIGGYNALIKEQREKGGEACVTTILFDTGYQTINSRIDIESVKDMDAKTYVPGGCTALLDALGTAISKLEETYSKMDESEIPEHVIFSIMTDGLENSSKEYSNKVVKALVEKKQKEGWHFLFQAANIDAFAEGGKLGINAANIDSFVASGKGVRVCFCMANARVSDIRSK